MCPLHHIVVVVVVVAAVAAADDESGDENDDDEDGLLSLPEEKTPELVCSFSSPCLLSIGKQNCDLPTYSRYAQCSLHVDSTGLLSLLRTLPDAQGFTITSTIFGCVASYNQLQDYPCPAALEVLPGMVNPRKSQRIISPSPSRRLTSRPQRAQKQKDLGFFAADRVAQIAEHQPN